MTSEKQISIIFVLVLATVCSPLANGQDASATGKSVADSERVLRDLKQFQLEVKSGSGSKLGPHLLALHKAYTQGPGAGVRAMQSRERGPLPVRNGYIRVIAHGDDAQALLPRLVAEGMLDAKVHEHSVSGRAPVSSLLTMAGTKGLRSIEPVLAVTQAGLARTQGDRAMRANLARQRFDVDGTGVRVGVLSDSFDCVAAPFFPDQSLTHAADDIASGDLPSDIHVLEDLSPTPSDECSDEGRAMMQIIHDVAPGAPLSFHTAAVSEEDFAEGILALARDGAQVIVDDLYYFNEPMFENGIVARAVNQVVKQGVAYFSIAGNLGRHSYEAKFRPTGNPDPFGETRHDFDPREGVRDLQPGTLQAQTTALVILNWDQPSISANNMRGSQSDVDIAFYNQDGSLIDFCWQTNNPVCQYPGLSDNIASGDAHEFAFIVNNSGQDIKFQIGIGLFTGPVPGLIKYVWYDDYPTNFGFFGIDEFDTHSSTTWGHPNAVGAEAVGAAWWFDTAAWGLPFHPECHSACLNWYSSAGGTPILFDDQGQRLRRPIIGFKPGVTGPDGGNTTFFLRATPYTVPGSTEPDQYPNFFGTSAAAPHVAAVAALMLEQRARDIEAGKFFLGPRKLKPEYIYDVLRFTASDMRQRDMGFLSDIGLIGFFPGTDPIAGAAGFDFDSGFGMVDAERALHVVAGH